jgi:hypothetical protein
LERFWCESYVSLSPGAGIRLELRERVAFRELLSTDLLTPDAPPPES